MREKVENGSTFLTDIHHRQTQMMIISGESDAGPVWRPEALFHERIGNPVGLVEIPQEYNHDATYVAARLKEAPHPRQRQRVPCFSHRAGRTADIQVLNNICIPLTEIPISSGSDGLARMRKYIGGFLRLSPADIKNGPGSQMP